METIYDQAARYAPRYVLLREILGDKPEMGDLKEIDRAYHASLEWMLKEDITDVLFETFSVRCGGTTIDLTPDGRRLDVTEKNKEAYVVAVSRWKLVESVRIALDCIKTGFYEVVPRELISGFNVDEFRRLINGSSEISVRELKLSATYSNGYTRDSRMVTLLWDILADMSSSWRSKVLAFVTGCPKVPLEGVSLEIVKSDAHPDNLPKSHTCFNQLVLPVYESRDQLHTKLFKALDCEGFYLT